MPKIPSSKNTDRATLRWYALQNLPGVSAHRTLTNTGRFSRLMLFMTLNPSEPQQPTLASPNPETSPVAIQKASAYRLILAPAASSSALRPHNKAIKKPNNLNKANLHQILKWTREDFTIIQTLIHSLAKDILDTSSTLKDQQESKLQELRKEVSTRHPVLSEYEGDWVTLEFLKRYLKNSSTRTRNQNAGQILDERQILSGREFLN
ncbi:hypothetical protein GALMADRAFT_134503 [Galerina marginata CBS 339.88]|uniref:Uncharacterized protein n=1 Tax=Galerina marginata (strain CBS 339.88) TaxID=685588 RepID=A0A067TL00_GALM3|nr:hypothetical protein GALMADRAFT_134503 [Galerina marginata CBS 339.88]